MGIHQGGVMLVTAAMMLYMGEGPRGSKDARSPLHQTSIFHSSTHNQTGPLWCLVLSGWACARPRPLWVSPTTSPVRLGVSPAAAPTPTGVFNQRFEALFPRPGALGCAVCFAPRHSSRFICAQVWGRGVPPAALPAPFSTTLESGPLGLSVCECGSRGCYPLLCLPCSPPLLSPALSVYLCKCGTAESASARTACAICPTLRQSRSHHSNASPLHPGAGLRPSYRSA